MSFGQDRPTVRKKLIVVTLLLILLLPNIGVALMATDLTGRCAATAAYLAISIVALLLPAVFMRARAYFILEGFCTLLLSPIEWSSLYLNRQSASVQWLNSIVSTDAQEAMEILSASWPVALGFMVLVVLYVALLSRIGNEYILSAAWRRGIMITAGCLLLGLYGSMCVLAKRFHSDYDCGQMMHSAVDMTRMKFNKIYPLNIYRNGAFLIKSRREWKQAQAQLSDFRFGITSVPQDSALFILFLGESTRYDHLQICGYERETTPMLSARTDIIRFDSVYSPGNTTQMVYPCLLTRATPEFPELAWKEKSLPEAFAEAGYSTAFISKNQGAFLERIIAQMDYSKLFVRGFDAVGNYDADLLPEVKGAYTGGPQMMTLSSVGSHFCYSLRYPEEEAFFTPSFQPKEGYLNVNEESKQRLINAYDNSIRFTDKVLTQLIEWADAQNRPAVILYLSDHGESFWDDDRKLSLHGSYLTSEAEYHIPLLVWCSDEYAALHPDKLTAMRGNTKKRICSTVVFASMADLADITELADTMHSIASPALQRQDTLQVINGIGNLVIFEK